MREVGPRLKVPLVVVTALVLHTTVLSRVRVVGIMPDVMLLLAVAGGVSGPAAGAVVGFLSGMGADLFLVTPLGLSALVFSLVGYAVGVVHTGVLRSAWWFPLAIAGAASAAGELLYAMIGGVLGERQLVTPRLGLIVVVVSLCNMLLARPVFRLVRWAIGTTATAPASVP